MRLTTTEKFYVVAFVFFATISCIASAKSLCLTFGMKGWILFILAIIGFFFLYYFTGQNFTKILNSLDDDYCTKKDIGKRRSRKMLFGGIAWVAFLWLIFSFPTNTHSLMFFRNSEKAVKDELENLKQVLQSKSDNKRYELKTGFESDSTQIASYFDTRKKDLDTEVNREDRRGFQERAKTIVDGVKMTYRTQMIEMEYRFNDPQTSLSDIDMLSFYVREFDKLCNALIGVRRNKYIQDISELNLQTKDLDKITTNISNILEAKTIDVETARKVIQEGKNLQAFKDDILDKAEELWVPSKGHTPDNVKRYNVYPIERLYSVFNVWGDYFSNRIPADFDMLYCILISLILDIVALGFYGAAFKGK